MAGYLVLARKYRSATFGQVVAQDPIATTLVSAIKTGRVAHAYLFTGTRGVGKTTMARILAKALNCLAVDEPTAEPCNKCNACQAIGRGDDVDVVEIDGASNRGIDEIRQLRANAILQPARSRFKIYYIDEVHMLTREAFNALLKTLEEPPGHVKFIFATTEVEKVPATIVSRCQRFDFRNIPTAKIAEHLAVICKAEKVKAGPDALFRVARAAAGSMRDGLSLLDQLLAGGEAKIADADVVRVLGTPSDERMLSIAGAIADRNAAGALAELAGVLADGVPLTTAATALGEIFRNMMIAATCGPDTELIELPETQKAALADLAGRFDTPALVHGVAVLQSAARSVRTSSLGRPLLEAVVVRLAEAEKFLSPETLLDRAERLEAPAGQRGAQKKNLPLTGAGRDGPSADQPARPARAKPDGPAPELQWEPEYLSAHWDQVVEALRGRGKMRVIGLLAAAKVARFADDLLTLSFDPADRILRDTCAGPQAGAITSALTDLAGREIRCQYICQGGRPSRSATAARPDVLSTAEKNGINKDPAVRTIVEYFDGEVIDIRKQAPLAASQPADDSKDDVT